MPHEAEHGGIPAATPGGRVPRRTVPPPEGGANAPLRETRGIERTDGIEWEGDPDAPTGRPSPDGL